MTDEQSIPETEDVDLSELQTELLNLRVGEVIPRLEIKSIRKITNRNREDNLARVDYKYAVEGTDGKVLLVNTWALWKQIAAALKEAGTIKATLELRHSAVGEYSVRVL